jgi:hypothetical protein
MKTGTPSSAGIASLYEARQDTALTQTMKSGLAPMFWRTGLVVVQLCQTNDYAFQYFSEVDASQAG